MKEKFRDARLGVFLIIIATLASILIIPYKADSYEFLIIPIIGIVSFIIPLFLSFSSEYNLGTKLSRGEVRKSIVISLTVMYIILLSLSFYGTTEELPTNAVPNDIADSNTGNTTAQNIPIQTIGNFTQNFLYVYVIIIGFYFGSRLGERIKMLKDFKNLKPLDILQKRYAMGEIDSNTFDKMLGRIAKQEELLNLDKLLETGEIDADKYKKYEELKEQLNLNNNESEKQQ